MNYRISVRMEENYYYANPMNQVQHQNNQKNGNKNKKNNDDNNQKPRNKDRKIKNSNGNNRTIPIFKTKLKDQSTIATTIEKFVHKCYRTTSSPVIKLQSIEQEVKQ